MLMKGTFLLLSLYFLSIINSAYNIEYFVEEKNEAVIFNCKDFYYLYEPNGNYFSLFDSDIIQKTYQGLLITIVKGIVTITNFNENGYGYWSCTRTFWKTKYFKILKILKFEISTSMTNFYIKLDKIPPILNRIYHNGYQCSINNDCAEILYNSDEARFTDIHKDIYKDVIVHVTHKYIHRYVFSEEKNTIKFADSNTKSISVQEVCSDNEKILFDDYNCHPNFSCLSLVNNKIQISLSELPFHKVYCSTQFYSRSVTVFLECPSNQVKDYNSRQCVEKTDHRKIDLVFYGKINAKIRHLTGNIVIINDKHTCDQYPCQVNNILITKVNDHIFVTSDIKKFKIKMYIGQNTLNFIFHNFYEGYYFPKDFKCTNLQNPTINNDEKGEYFSCKYDIYEEIHYKIVKKLKTHIIDRDGRVTFKCKTGLYSGNIPVCGYNYPKEKCRDLEGIIKTNNDEYVMETSYFYRYSVFSCDSALHKLIPKYYVTHKKVNKNSFEFCSGNNYVLRKKDSSENCVDFNTEICKKLLHSYEDYVIIKNTAVHTVTCNIDNILEYSYSWINIGEDYIKNEETYSYETVSLDCSNNNKRCHKMNAKSLDEFNVKCPNKNGYSILYNLTRSDPKSLLFSTKTFLKIDYSSNENNAFTYVAEKQDEYLCLDKSDYYINQLPQSLHIDTLHFYDSDAIITIKTNEIFGQATIDIESSLSDKCNLLNLNFCKNENIFIKKDAKNFEIFMNFSDSLNFNIYVAVFSMVKSVSFNLVKRNDKPVTYNDGVLKFHNFCKHDKLIVMIDDQKCKSNDVLEECSNYLEWKIPSMEVVVKSKLITKIICDEEYYTNTQTVKHGCITKYSCKKMNSCIDHELVCNGFSDCPDNEDEENCKNYITINPIDEKSFLLKCPNPINENKNYNLLAIKNNQKIFECSFDELNLTCKKEMINFTLNNEQIKMSLESTTSRNSMNLYACSSISATVINKLTEINEFTTIHISNLMSVEIKKTIDEEIKIEGRLECAQSVDGCSGKYQIEQKRNNTLKIKYLVEKADQSIVELLDSNKYTKFTINIDTKGRYQDSVINVKSLCSLDSLSFSLNGKICLKNKQEECKELLEWTYQNDADLIHFLFNGNVTLKCLKESYNTELKFKACKADKFFCAKENQCSERISVYDLSNQCGDLSENSLKTYNFKNAFDEPFQISCDEIKGNLKIREGMLIHQHLPSYIIKQEKEWYKISKPTKTNKMLTCVGNIMRVFKMEYTETISIKELEVKISDYCTKANVVITNNHNQLKCSTKNSNECSNVHVVIDRDLMYFKKKNTFTIQCLDEYVFYTNKISIECPSDKYHLCLKSLTCLEKLKICDGAEQCEDDELNCQNYFYISPFEPDTYKLKCPFVNKDDEYYIKYIKLKESIDIGLVEVSKLIYQNDNIYYRENNEIFLKRKNVIVLSDHICWNGLNKYVNKFIQNYQFFVLKKDPDSSIYIECDEINLIFMDNEKYCNGKDICPVHPTSAKLFKIVPNDQLDQPSNFECRRKNISSILIIKKIKSIKDQSSINIGLMCELENVIFSTDNETCDISNDFCKNTFTYKDKVVSMKKQSILRVLCTRNSYLIEYHFKHECPADHYMCKGNKLCIKNELVYDLVIQCGESKKEVVPSDSYKIRHGTLDPIIIDCTSLGKDVRYRIGKKICDGSCAQNVDVVNNTLVFTNFNLSKLPNQFFYCFNSAFIKEFVLLTLRELSLRKGSSITQFCSADYKEITFDMFDATDKRQCTLKQYNKIKCDEVGIVKKDDQNVEFTQFLLFKTTCNSPFYISSIYMGCNIDESMHFCFKLNKCLHIDSVCDGTNQCGSEDFMCTNILYIPASGINEYRLPLIDLNAELFEIVENRKNRINLDKDDESVPINGITYKRLNGQISIKLSENIILHTHVLKANERFQIMKFIKDNIISEIDMSSRQSVTFQCEFHVYKNFEKVIDQNNKMFKIQNNEFILIKTDQTIEVSLVNLVSDSMAIDCMSIDDNRNHRFYINKVESKKVEYDESKSLINYQSFCSVESLYYENDKIMCKYIGNLGENCQILITMLQENVFKFNFAGYYRMICEFPTYNLFETVNSVCNSDSYQCPITNECLPSKEVYDIGQQCDESFQEIEDKWTVVSLLEEKASFKCKELNDNVDFLLGKYKICSTEQCESFMVEKNVFTVELEYVLTKIKYSCSDNTKIKSFYINPANDNVKLENINEVSEICPYDFLSFEIMREDISICIYDALSESSAENCSLNQIYIDSKRIRIEKMKNFKVKCNYEHYISTLSYSLECIDESYYLCFNKRCLLKEELFSLQKECDEDDLAISNIQVVSYESEVEIHCTSSVINDANLYNLYQGLKAVCYTKNNCINEISRRSLKSFKVPFSLRKNPNYKLFCSQNEFLQSEKSFTFIEQKEVLSLESEKISLQSLKRLYDKIYDFQIFSTIQNEQCSLKDDSNEHCQKIDIHGDEDREFLTVPFDKEFTLKIHTIDYSTSIRIIVPNTSKNTESQNTSSTNIIAIIIPIVLLLVFIIVIISIVMIKRRRRMNKSSVYSFSLRSLQTINTREDKTIDLVSVNPIEVASRNNVPFSSISSSESLNVTHYATEVE